MKIKYLLAATVFGTVILSGCGQSAQESAPAEPAAAEPAAAEPAAAEMDLAAMLASDARSEADQARDAGRNPVEVLDYLGVEPGMDVIDVIAAGGWYTEVLSLAVGPEGSVVAQNPAFVLEFRDGANDKALNERLAGDRLPNVTRLNKEFADMSGADGQFDVALTALNFHDMYNGQGPEAAVEFLRVVGTLLKPGGVFGVVDHTGIADADNASLHRVEVAQVIASAEAAGLIVDGQSDVLANSGDDHTQPVFAEGVRGQTDRFVIKLRKPE
jgi:predicted methyltransferase